ncbi:hypothetical protein [Bowmanella denitrificans]|uniref:hypothetical protein n=1 Tax=Bowmanella denitrificans TaxID=366582 RepID=UPI000C9A93C8|nr:hypothetical protein [Bowmanella denitrificans]
MGSKSKSQQQTTNQQTTTNHVNDGEFAGASNIVIDESDRSVEDSNNTTLDIRDSNNTDNSQEVEIKDSFNTTTEITTDIRQEYDQSTTNSGEYAGNTGTITITDGGAIDQMGQTSREALKEGFEFGGDVIAELRKQSEEYAHALEAQFEDFTSSLSANAAMTAQTNASVLQSLNESSTADKQIIADLAKSTALDGQDVVAKTSERMILYVSGAFGLIALVLLIKGGR